MMQTDTHTIRLNAYFAITRSIEEREV